MGSPEFALPSLKALRQTFSEDIIAVFTRPDAPKGRGKKLVSTPIKSWALSQEIPVYTPHNKDELQSEIVNLDPDLIVVIAYGMIFPQVITDKYFCLNVHGSLLPKFRGASPIQASLLNGDTETGITLMKMNESMDKGAILSKETITIQDNDNLASLHDKLAELGSKVLPGYISDHLITGQFTLTPQDHVQASYCKKIQKTDLELDLKQTPIQILRKIRAFSPIPGAFVINNNRRVKILDAKIVDDELNILQVKPEGKSIMSYHDYCLAHPKIL
jgi:methionyl-tRNA formyltransferase